MLAQAELVGDDELFGDDAWPLPPLSSRGDASPCSSGARRVPAACALAALAPATAESAFVKNLRHSARGLTHRLPYRACRGQPERREQRRGCWGSSAAACRRNAGARAVGSHRSVFTRGQH